MEKKFVGNIVCGAITLVMSLAIVQILPLLRTRGSQVLILPLIYAVSLAVSGVGVLKLRNWARILMIFLVVVWCGIGLTGYLMFASAKTNEISFLAFLFLFVTPTVFMIGYLTTPSVRARFEDAIHWLGKKILVIDDDKGFLRMIKTNLVSRGFEVMTALTGEKGITLARNRNPDLIILDVILPGIKGREVCARLKEDLKTKNIPVIFLTAKNSPDDIKAEMEAGGVIHITKPLDFQRLLGEMKRILGL